MPPLLPYPPRLARWLTWPLTATPTRTGESHDDSPDCDNCTAEPQVTRDGGLAPQPILPADSVLSSSRAGGPCADVQNVQLWLRLADSAPHRDRRGCHSEGLATGQTTFPASCSGLMNTTAFAASSFAERVRASEK